MPYIAPAQRHGLHPDPGRIAENAGELNFQITDLVDQYLIRHGLNYGNINAVVGALECAKLELYRRIAAPYEDKKILDNGDVYACPQAKSTTLQGR